MENIWFLCCRIFRLILQTSPVEFEMFLSPITTWLRVLHERDGIIAIWHHEYKIQWRLAVISTVKY